MKIINLEQGSPSWLSWRKTVITATDCSAIRGNSPWSTPYKCWQKKLGLIEDQKSNDAMERGKRLEPILREKFIESWNINMTPHVVESSEYSFLGASLDGLSDCGKYILEIKTGGEKLHDMAKREEIPLYYMDQIQQQLLVTGAEKCLYVVGDEEDFMVITVYPDPEFAKEYIPVAREFWKCVAFNEPPALQDSDYKDMSEEPSWRLIAEKYLKIDQQIKELEEIKEIHRKELLALCNDQNCLGGGIKIMKIPVKGRVVYDDIPELKGVILDQYRKSSTITWKITVDKKK
jgi:putative phage-type endonuclease